jgi:hypothetical protein
MKLAPTVLLLSFAALCACSSGTKSSATADQQQYDYSTQGTAATSATASAALGVNAYLWRGSLDTLSFMPLVSADPFGGVIITDWYTPPGVTGERFKATIYVLGRELRSDALKVSIFRQTNTGSGWQDTQVAASTETEIEDKILYRARELRAAANGAG